MFLSVFSFEFHYHRRQYLFYILSSVFFLLAFLGTTSDNISIGGNFPNININAPITVITTLSTLSILALFGAVAFCASGVIRDYEYKTAELFLTTNVSKFDYIYGRFFGSLLFSFGIYFGGLLGVAAGEFAPWLDQERLGSFRWDAYWFASWAIVLPNLFFMSCIVFCVATVTRSLMLTYVAAIALIMATFVMGSFTEPETVDLVSKLEPFGLTALGEQTRYWTVFERNAMIPAMEGNFLINRGIWMTVGVFFLALAWFAFPFSVEKVSLGPRGWRQRRLLAAEKSNQNSAPINNAGSLLLPKVTRRFGLATQVSQYLSQTRIEVRNTVFSGPFIVMLLLGILNVTGAAAGSLDNIFGTPVYPTTATMVLLINGSLAFSLLGVLVYYSGEIMLKERTAHFSDIIDSLPYPNWIMMMAKLTGLAIVISLMLLISMLAAIGIQLVGGYHELNLLAYLQGLFVFFQFPLYFMCVLALFFFVITRSRYITMFLLILYTVGLIAIPQSGFENYLYRMDQPGVPYSIFTGYSQLLEANLWFTFYWSLWGVLLLVSVHLLWPRGSEFTWRTVTRVARQRFTPGVAVLTTIAALSLLATGGYIHYNTAVLNQYASSLDQEAQVAEYEKRYKQYQFLPQPSIYNVYAEVDIYPAEREVSLSGYYDVRNQTDEPIDTLHFTVPPWLTISALEVPDSELTLSDPAHGYYIYALQTPLAVGSNLRINYQIDWLTPGFRNNGASMKLAANGTFFNNQDLFPLVGYQSGPELQDNARRRKYDLGPIERMSAIDDEAAHQRVSFSGGRADFETVVSTSLGQTAIAPGYLKRQWVEGDRAYFYYKMDAPIWSFYSFLSGDYEVRRDTWNDIAIEVYYKHDYNVDRMIEATKKSLAYFEENFTPYQYRQFRIIEFPRYQGSFAQSFPNTIPFSESIGFVADLRDKTSIDYVFYVTAHELAHQWWAHQVLGADTQGQTMIVESLAQYFALMVMEKEYGKDTMKRFLEFELDRYLTDRGGELIEELPLYLVENQQYIHYRKGSVALYALRDYIGEAPMNLALKRFLETYAFKEAPYPTTLDLIREIRLAAGPQHDDLITDMLQKIVLFDLKVDDVKVTTTDDGDYSVTLDVSLTKFEADGEGQETEVPVDGLFDIALLGEKDSETGVHQVIYLEKHAISDNQASITVTANTVPLSVGIDPFNKLIDRNPDDNIKLVDR